MKDFGTVTSAVRPEPLIIDKYSVWVHTDIQEIEITSPDGSGQKLGYQYRKIQYDKDEYIRVMSKDLNNVQMAICELYELQTGEG